jgi:hypothetical protein
LIETGRTAFTRSRSVLNMLATAHTSPDYAPPRRRRSTDVGDIVATATVALHEIATAEPALHLDDVARWCAAYGGVDPRLERAALTHALELVNIDVLIADLVVSLRGRLIAAGELLPALVECGGVPLVLAAVGLDDVDPPAEALSRAVPPRIARFYWQRLRAFVSWSASCAWT